MKFTLSEIAEANKILYQDIADSLIDESEFWKYWAETMFAANQRVADLNYERFKKCRLEAAGTGNTP